LSGKVAAKNKLLVRRPSPATHATYNWQRVSSCAPRSEQAKQANRIYDKEIELHVQIATQLMKVWGCWDQII
jgi:hypothetical protein